MRERDDDRPAMLATCTGSALAWLALFASGCVFDVSSEPLEASRGALQGTMDPRRSLAVTDQRILERFSLQRVMDQLVEQSGVPDLTSLTLFRQWWDSLNPGPGLGLGTHCDDVRDVRLGPVLNDFPFACPAPTQQAGQAGCDPFAPGSTCTYAPIGLFNRFDLMPGNGADCGAYTIAFARVSATPNAAERMFLSFEAVLPNPSPELGIEGCRPVVELWAGLSDISFPQERAERLEQLYFNGLPEAVPAFPPVIRAEHLGAADSGRGQVRTSHVVHSAPSTASLREFKLKRSCGPQRCAWLRFLPVTAKGSAYAPLFNAATQHAKRAGFQAYLPGQVRTLVGSTIPEIFAATPDAYNSGVSEGSDRNGAAAYEIQFGSTPSPLRNALDDALAESGSSLTADHVVARVQALSCIGCHGLSNLADLGDGLTWPASLGFNHVSDSPTEPIDGGARYQLSPALTDAFLPHRQALLEHYLARELDLSARTPERSIGGSLVH